MVLSSDTATVSEDADGIRPRTKPRSLADRFMRKLLFVDKARSPSSSESSAQRYLRTSMVITGIRCLITYLLIPIVVPIIGLSGVVSAPIGLLLSLIAVLSGVVSLRKFWMSDHRLRWMYTAFIFVVFVILTITLYADISTIVRSI